MAKEKVIKGGNDFRHENQDFRATKDRLDGVGCGFCLAKMDTSYITDANRTQSLVSPPSNT